MFIVTGKDLPENPDGALTLDPEILGEHEDGWEIVADICEDCYEWVNTFVAYKHDPSMSDSQYGFGEKFVAGNFETEVVASDEETYKEFLEKFPPQAWDYGDI
jgi:hypothetical protein